MAGDADRAYRAGMDAHVTKPVDRHELHLTLNRLLAGATPGAPSRSGVDDGDFDERAFEQLHELDETGEVLHSLVALFVRDTPLRLDALGVAARRRDLDAVRTLAHTTKGSAAALGALTLARLCGEIEHDARHGTPPGAERLAAVRTALEHTFAWLADHPGPSGTSPIETG